MACSQRGELIAAQLMSLPFSQLLLPYHLLTSVRTRLSAPFILSLCSASSASCKFLACLSGCYPSTLPIESANWEISAAPALPLDRQRERAKLLMVDFDLDVVGGADGFELRSEVCGDEDESLVFFQAGMM